MNEASMPIWVVYDSPLDLPGRFVARKWVLDKPTAEILQGKTLEEVRAQLPPGLVCLARADEDDPKIVETWI